MVYRTLKEWNNKGRSVKRGEKSLLKCPITNTALFHKKQTKKVKYKSNEPYHDPYVDGDIRVDENYTKNMFTPSQCIDE